MVQVDTAVEARITKNGKHFVVLVDCDLALAFRRGEDVALSDVLASDDVYADARKGLRAAEKDLEAAFGTSNVTAVAEKIIKHGEVVLTAEHHRRLFTQLKKQIVNAIARDAINPQTNTPHPPDRIANAMDEAKVRIDVHKHADAQVQDIVKQLSRILPIRIEVRELQVQIPAQFAQQSFRILKDMGTMKRQEWLNDGSLFAIICLPAGQQEALEHALGKLTRGDYDLKIRS